MKFAATTPLILTVPSNCKSRHIANEIFKEADIDAKI